jgi:hypothetical protein
MLVPDGKPNFRSCDVRASAFGAAKKRGTCRFAIGIRNIALGKISGTTIRAVTAGDGRRDQDPVTYF